VKPVRSITILGKRYRLRFIDGRKLPFDYAQCDEQKAIAKEIRIRQELQRKPRDLVETVIHELLHAADWHLSESFVDATARDIERVLHRLGFGKVTE
jgi:hypothetical protein